MTYKYNFLLRILIWNKCIRIVINRSHYNYLKKSHYNLWWTHNLFIYIYIYILLLFSTGIQSCRCSLFNNFLTLNDTCSSLLNSNLWLSSLIWWGCLCCCLIRSLTSSSYNNLLCRCCSNYLFFNFHFLYFFNSTIFNWINFSLNHDKFFLTCKIITI